MANSIYIQSLKHVIRELHGCDSDHVESLPVQETFRGETIWNGTVEVFDLRGHPSARRCYAWGERKSDEDKGAKFFTVLELPPVTSAESAVKVAIANEIKGKR